MSSRLSRFLCCTKKRGKVVPCAGLCRIILFGIIFSGYIVKNSKIGSSAEFGNCLTFLLHKKPGTSHTCKCEGLCKKYTKHLGSIFSLLYLMYVRIQ